MPAWTEPALAPTEALLDLLQPAASVPKLLLKANVPSTVRLTGPADLLFANLTLTLTALPLDRNLALPEWGSSRSTVEVDGGKKALEFLLPGLNRVEAVGIRAATEQKSIKIEIKDAGQYRPITSSLSLTGQDQEWSGLVEQAFQTDAVRVHLTGDDVAVLLRSPSLPARVGVAVGNDTPVQVFPAQMELAGTVTTRNLAPYLNAAWQERRAEGTVEVVLRLTSLTDGVVSLNLNGVWNRSHVLGPMELTLDPFNPATVTVDWPAEDMPEALASLGAVGQLGRGMRQGLVEGAANFGVRMRGNVELAQPFLLGDGGTISDSVTLLGFWLMLTELPTSDEQLDLWLAEAEGEGLHPAEKPLVSLQAVLPASKSAYIATETGYWLRALLPKPFEVSGAQVSRPLFLGAGGKAASLLLAQQFALPSPGEAEGQKLAVGKAGLTLVRNLDWAEPWRPLTFSQKTAIWQADLEIAPPAHAYRMLVWTEFPDQAPLPLPFEGADSRGAEAPWVQVARPADGKLAIRVYSKSTAQLDVRVRLLRSLGS